jgi:hypothetical protein
LANVRQLDTLKSEMPMWRRIISPEHKEDWVASVIGLVLGAFTDFVNVVQRIVHPHWLLLVCVLGMVGVVVPCRRRVRVAWDNFTQDRTKRANMKSAVECWQCSFLRFFLFSFLAVLLLSKTEYGKQGMEAIAARLTSMDAKLGHIDSGVDKINSKLDGLKPQIATDPRELLAKSGAFWTVDAFFDAIRRGDDKNVKLFLAGHMTTDVPDSQGRPLPVILALNTTNAPVMLDLLIAGGLDVNHSYEVAGALHPQRMTLLSRAIEKGSPSLVETLIKHQVDINSPIQTFGAMGLTRDTYPLVAAIYWKRLEIAQLLLDAGADPAAGDYAAYGEARALRDRSNGDVELSGRLDALIERLKPHGSAAARIETQLRLQVIEQKLNQVALGSLRVPPGSPERRRLDAEYDQLQLERTKLRNALSMPAK